MNRLAIILACLSSLAWSQEYSTTARHAVVYCTDRPVIGGRLVAVGEEDIILLSTRQEERIPISSISKIIVVVEGTSGHGATYGALIGSYLSGYFITRNLQDNQSGISTFVYMVSLLPGLLVGGGLGYLFDSGSNAKELVFDFLGPENARLKSTEQLRKLVNNEPGVQRIRVSVGGAYVPRVNPPSIPQGFPQYATGYSEPNESNYKFLRRADLSYSLVPEVAAGVALVWFGDLPSYSNNWQNMTGGYQVNSTSDGLGRYAIIKIDPLLKSLKQTMTVEIGGGIGVASIDVSQNWIWSRSDSVAYTSGAFERRISDSFISGVVFAQVGLKIYDGLSIGLSVDHVFGPTGALPAYSSIGLPEESYRFSSTSVGFTLALHY